MIKLSFKAFKALESKRNSWESTWQEVAAFVIPVRITLWEKTINIFIKLWLMVKNSLAGG